MAMSSESMVQEPTRAALADHMVGFAMALDTSCHSTRSSHSVGSNGSWMIEPAPHHSPGTGQSEPQNRFVCVMTTPLGFPALPEVYLATAGESESTSEEIGCGRLGFDSSLAESSDQPCGAGLQFTERGGPSSVSIDERSAIRIAESLDEKLAAERSDHVFLFRIDWWPGHTEPTERSRSQSKSNQHARPNSLRHRGSPR